MLFSPDMDRRLFDLHTALSGGATVQVQFHPAYEHTNTSLPDRVWVDIVGTERRLVFDVPTAAGLADQLTANGFDDAAGVIRTAIPNATAP